MLSILLLQGSLLVSPVTQAPAEAPLLEQKTWSGSADISIQDVSGNNESSTAAANLSLDWEGDLDILSLGAHYAGVRTSDKTTADATTTSRLYQYDAAYHRFFSEEKDLYGYVNAATRQDEPNGLQMRASSGIGAGYHFQLYAEGDLDLEGGASFVTENKIGTVNETSGVGRMAFEFSGPWLEHLDFTASGEFLRGGDIESYVQELGVSWELNDTWTLKLSNNIAWDGNPSVGFSSTDRRWNLLLGTSF